MKDRSKRIWTKLSEKLSKLGFRTGVIILCICVVCYGISFLQFLLPISLTAKGILWFIFFGLAKATQYAGLLIIGVDGVKRLKQIFNRKQKH